MNLDGLVSPIRGLAFRTWRHVTASVPGPRICAFGAGPEQIGSILVLNLDRQPNRWRRVSRELGRLRTAEGVPLTSITKRLSAVDARDGRAVAATADVDTVYRVGDQLHVQPDKRLAECFAEDEPVRMTRQEVAVARSHVEAWKTVASGTEDYVLILEDDVWFTPGAPAAIDSGWRAALRRSEGGGPKLLYFSYSDAGGTADRADPCDHLFRPLRGLWFLSGYVISRPGAAALLRAMPVVGPVDLWMNFRLAEMGALALRSPAIAQRQDEESENVYSILPYLARAGIVDAEQSLKPPISRRAGPVLAWTQRGEHEGLAMALSMLGLRVLVFDEKEEPLLGGDLDEVLQTFDALVDPRLAPDVLARAVAHERVVILLEPHAIAPLGLQLDGLSPSRSARLASEDSWDELCSILGFDRPAEAFPQGAPRALRVFRASRACERPGPREQLQQGGWSLDDSPWVVSKSDSWQPQLNGARSSQVSGSVVVDSCLTTPSASFLALIETFPGNLATFTREGLKHTSEGAKLEISAVQGAIRPFRSGAFSSQRSFQHGRFEADIRAAPGAGLVTGFFLHRDRPRQEIDIEFSGADPQRMLVNVFFNPGDDGTAMDYGYRGSPCWIDLGFDSSAGFHRYAIDWRPDRLVWLVDGKVVHERLSWDPTPIPHLKMRVFANLWAPRSDELAGRIAEEELPAAAVFRNVRVMS